jgi:hypothetical protein
MTTQFNAHLIAIIDKKSRGNKDASADSITEQMIIDSQEVIAKLDSMLRGDRRVSREGMGQFYCIECDRWLSKPAKVIGEISLCSCGLELSQIPF